MLSGKMRVVLVITLAVIFTFSLHPAKFFEGFHLTFWKVWSKMISNPN